jgi:hypothetical protein
MSSSTWRSRGQVAVAVGLALILAALLLLERTGTGSVHFAELTARSQSRAAALRQQQQHAAAEQRKSPPTTQADPRTSAQRAIDENKSPGQVCTGILRAKQKFDNYIAGQQAQYPRLTKKLQSIKNRYDAQLNQMLRDHGCPAPSGK